MEMMRRQRLNTATQLSDLLLMTLSFGTAALAVMGRSEPFTQFLSMKIKVQNFVLFFCLLYVWHLVFKTVGLYGSKRLSSRRAEAVDILKATGLATTALVVASFVLKFRMVTPRFAALFWAFSAISIISTRTAIRSWLRHLRRRGKNLRNMLIVGSNGRAI